MHCNLENSTFDPFMYIMGSPMLIMSICMGKFIRKQRVNIVFQPICFVLCFASLFKVWNLSYRRPVRAETRLHRRA